MNAQHSFALFHLTTLVIYAEDKTKVEQSMAAILKAADEHKWEVTIPPARDWAPESRYCVWAASFGALDLRRTGGFKLEILALSSI
jgi:hypothetical protein